MLAMAVKTQVPWGVLVVVAILAMAAWILWELRKSKT